MQIVNESHRMTNPRVWKFTPAKVVFALAGSALILTCIRAYAQGPGEGDPSKSYQTFYLLNSQTPEANDIQTDLRNMLPKSAIYYVPSQGALSVRGTTEDIATAKKILSEIDRPRKVWQLTYTLAEMEGDKVIATHKYAMSVTSGKRTSLKEGNRIPLVTGKSDNPQGNSGSQVQYVDIGINIEATLDGSKLQTKVEQSSLALENATPSGSAHPVDDPVIRQSTLEETVTLAEGKPILLGILELPEGRHSLHVTVLSEPDKQN